MRRIVSTSSLSSVLDYAELITTRYSEALKHADDPEQFLKELVKGGYASDEKYVEKVMAIITQYELQKLDKPSKAKQDSDKKREKEKQIINEET